MRMSMRILFLSLLLVAVAAPWSGAEAGIYKCSINGRIAYQDNPCPSGQQRQMPTVEQLNAARKKSTTTPSGSPVPLPATESAPLPLAKTSPKPVFACDGRTYCSQMTSCSEAKFFLAKCPNTKMDGDRDGIPCEEQWCH